MQHQHSACCLSGGSSSTTRSTNRNGQFSRCLFSLSILVNVAFIAPIILLTSQFYFHPNGISVDISHDGIQSFLRAEPIPEGVLVSPPANDNDNLNQIGKSCIFKGEWRCQDCGIKVKDKCQRLQRVRRKCDKPMHENPWDTPPRVASSFDPEVVETVPMRTIHRPQKQWSLYLKQPLCTIDSCFDLSRCNASILTIYTNGQPYRSQMVASKSYNSTFTVSGLQLMEYADQHSSLIRRVHSHEEACISIIFPDTYATPDDLYRADHWQDHGRNNLLYDMGNFDMNSWTGDHVYQAWHYEYAAVASQSLNRPTIRRGYDQVLPLPRRWQRPLAPAKVDIHRPRKWLVTFRGDIQHKGIPYYNHRWLASEYWENATDIYVDVQCRKNRRVYKQYDTPGTMYHEIMMNSTFGFCPGGAGVSSYRLGEYMSTGTIPVVVGDIAAPFAPEVDWSQCWIEVSEARVVDIPRILRAMPADEIRKRQKRCWELHEMIWGEQNALTEEGGNGWVDDPAITFARALEIWAIRIRNAIESVSQMQAVADPNRVK